MPPTANRERAARTAGAPHGPDAPGRDGPPALHATGFEVMRTLNSTMQLLFPSRVFIRPMS